MGLVLTTGPTVEPVTLAEAKSHLRIDITDDDTDITALIVAAREYIETQLNKQLITATYTWRIDTFPLGVKPFVIPYPAFPLQTVTSINYIDVDGDSQLLATSVYNVNTDDEPAEITLKFDQTWPDIRTQDNAVTLVLVAGFGDAASDVPESLEVAIKLLVGHFYENREATVSGTILRPIPLGVKSILTAYKAGTQVY